jgi:hypothetical protein
MYFVKFTFNTKQNIYLILIQYNLAEFFFFFNIYFNIVHKIEIHLDNKSHLLLHCNLFNNISQWTRPLHKIFVHINFFSLWWIIDVYLLLPFLLNFYCIFTLYYVVLYVFNLFEVKLIIINKDIIIRNYSVTRRHLLSIQICHQDICEFSVVGQLILFNC